MTPKCPDCKMDQDECICSSPVSAPEALDWLETELSAISCRYHGDPSYDHDAYWMRGRVEKLLEEARKLFTAPTPPSTEDQKDAERYRWLIDNSFDKGITQFHVWKHTWEPHSKTGEQIEWKQRISGPPLNAAIDAAMQGDKP